MAAPSPNAVLLSEAARNGQCPVHPTRGHRIQEDSTVQIFGVDSFPFPVTALKQYPTFDSDPTNAGAINTSSQYPLDIPLFTLCPYLRACLLHNRGMHSSIAPDALLFARRRVQSLASRLNWGKRACKRSHLNVRTPRASLTSSVVSQPL